MQLTEAEVAVVGAGLIGHGIALDFASHGHHVRLYGRSEARLEHAKERIRAGLQILQDAEQLTVEQAEAALARVRTETVLAEAVADVAVVIEAVSEDLPLKQGIFGELDRLCGPAVILASTTSTFLASALAVNTSRPDRVLVTHYFNPPYLLPLVEVVPGPGTSSETVSTIVALLERIGKHPALVRQEIVGFLGVRLQAALLREAFALVDRGVATPADIDAVVRYGFGRRLGVAGVFEIADLAGLDLYDSALGPIFADLDASPGIPRALRERVARGEFGVKTGKGFYTWTAEAVEGTRKRIGRALVALSVWDTTGETR